MNVFNGVTSPRVFSCHCTLPAGVNFNLKGLGHAILGNFSTDQMVIEITKI